jgi:Zn-finger nucleic acid-binding protein
MQAVACPNCAAPMKRETYEGAGIDRCASCGGAWLGQVEMGLIVQRREEDFSTEVVKEARGRAKQGASRIAPEERARNLPCPVCARKMLPSVYNYSSGIVINRCPQEHGLYLDKGELELVQAHAEFLDAALAGAAKTYLHDQRPSADAAVAEAESAPDPAELAAQASWNRHKTKPLDKVLDWLGKRR